MSEEDYAVCTPGQKRSIIVIMIYQRCRVRFVLDSPAAGWWTSAPKTMVAPACCPNTLVVSTAFLPPSLAFTLSRMLAITCTLQSRACFTSMHCVVQRGAMGLATTRRQQQHCKDTEVVPTRRQPWYQRCKGKEHCTRSGARPPDFEHSLRPGSTLRQSFVQSRLIREGVLFELCRLDFDDASDRSAAHQGNVARLSTHLTRDANECVAGQLHLQHARKYTRCTTERDKHEQHCYAHTPGLCCTRSITKRIVCDHAV